jgi:type IV pilus assembly protein PilE
MNKGVPMSRQRGFTLLELMIAVAIVAILAAVALPSYNDYITRSRFSEATAALANGRVAFEQYYQDARSYVGFPAVACPADSAYWNYTCAAAEPPQTFSITADGLGAMAGFQFTVDQANSRASAVTGTPATKGWAGNTTCWIVRKGGGCA